METRGFSKIWLTHDIDMPFYYYNFIDVIKQFVKNIIRRGEKVQKPLHVFITGENDPYNTFSKINSFDSKIIENYSRNVAQDIYFIISVFILMRTTKLKTIAKAYTNWTN